MIVTPQGVAAVWDMLRAMPPFSRWSLPPAEEVEFRTPQRSDVLGEWTKWEGGHHIVTISSKSHGHLQTLIQTVAHEMLHAYQDIKGTSNRAQHNGGTHAAYNNTVASGVTLVTGHDHRADVVSYDDRRGRRYGVRHGMGADSARDAPFVHYLEGRTPSWQSGLAVLTYKDGMLLMPELALRVSEDSFQFRGEIIKC